MNKHQWNLSPITKLSIQENAFGNDVCEMGAILSRGRWDSRGVPLLETVFVLVFILFSWCTCCIYTHTQWERDSRCNPLKQDDKYLQSIVYIVNLFHSSGTMKCYYKLSKSRYFLCNANLSHAIYDQKSNMRASVSMYTPRRTIMILHCWCQINRMVTTWL